MKKLAPILLLVLIFTGCESYQYERIPGYGLEFYRLRSFQKLANTSKIIESSVILSDTLFLTYDDIISYNTDSYTFTVSKRAADYLADYMHNNIHRAPFAVTINKKLIYTGYFWFSFSSMSADWVIIDPLNYSGKNKLCVQLGYPGMVEGDSIPDKRNDRRILNFLQGDGKLNKSK